MPYVDDKSVNMMPYVLSCVTENELMIRSTTTSPNKRAKTQFLWSRLIFDKTEYGKLSVIERPNMKILSAIKDMNADLLLDDMSEAAMKTCMGELDRLYNSLVSGGGKRTAIYEQHSFKDAIAHVPGYGGCELFGRAYSNSNLQYIKAKVLNTIYKTSHVDVDITGSFSTMLWNALGDDSMEWMKYYVESPDRVYEKFQEEDGISRDKIKTAICSMIGSHPRKPNAYGLDEDRDSEIVRQLGENPFINGFYQDLCKATIKMRQLYPEFVRVIDAHCVLKHKADMSAGIAMTLLAGDMEHAVMRTVIDKLCGDKRENFVWKFDGVLVDKFCVGDDWEAAMADLSALVMEKYGIKVKFCIKHPTSRAYPIALPAEELVETNDGYGAWKLQFETEFFRLSDPPVFCQLRDDGSVMDLNAIQFKHNTMEQPDNYIKQWMSDKFKRAYTMKDFAPPPLEPLRGSYNTWAGLAYDNIDVVVPDDYSLDMYKKHVHLLMGSNDSYANYFHKLIAIKLQQPGYQWRVMPFVRSTPGVGKDVFFSFLERLFGRVNCVRVGRLSDILDKSSHLMDSKILVCFSEVEYQDNQRLNEQLKNAITSEDIVVKKKYVNEYSIRSVACFMAFSNNFGAFQIPADDRRFFCVTADGVHANDPAYHMPLIEYLSKPETVKAVGNWYMSMDVSNFNPSGERPMTETFQEMASSSLSIMDIMIRKNMAIWMANARSAVCPGYKIINETVLQVPVKIFWDDFQQLCTEFKLQNADSRQKIVQLGSRMLGESVARMKRFKTQELDSMFDVMVTYRSHGSTFKRMDIAAMQKYITEMLGEDQDDTSNGGEDGMAEGFVP